MTEYRFLLDNNCAKAAEFFPRSRTLTLKQAGIKHDATDREIVETACDRKWIVVTSNGDDFITEFNRFLAQSTKATCHDLNGLVILPSEFEAQRYAMNRIADRLMLDGKHQTWKDVWELDCLVRVTRSGVTVTRFDRCFYCKKAGVL